MGDPTVKERCSLCDGSGSGPRAALGGVLPCSECDGTGKLRGGVNNGTWMEAAEREAREHERTRARLAEVEAERDQQRDYRIKRDRLSARADADHRRDLQLANDIANEQRTRAERAEQDRDRAMELAKLTCRQDHLLFEAGHAQATEELRTWLEGGDAWEALGAGDEFGVSGVHQDDVGNILNSLATLIEAGTHRPKDGNTVVLPPGAKWNGERWVVPVLPTSEADEAIVDALVARRGMPSAGKGWAPHGDQQAFDNEATIEHGTSPTATSSPTTAECAYCQEQTPIEDTIAWGNGRRCKEPHECPTHVKHLGEVLADGGSPGSTEPPPIRTDCTDCTHCTNQHLEVRRRCPEHGGSKEQ